MGVKLLSLAFAACILAAPVISQTYTDVGSLLSVTPELSTLLTAAQTAGLAAPDAASAANYPGTLSDPALQATIFAPSNTAFAALLAQLGLTTEELLALPSLGNILKYHVVTAVAKAADLTNGQALPTLLGPELTVTLSGTSVIIAGATNNATVTTPDLMAGESVVHIIDAVLLPPASSPAPAPGPAPSK